MSLHQGIVLFFAALAAGALNSVAGGGSFISFPALVLAGVLPINANATNTVALWPGTVASSGAYRRELQGKGARVLAPLIATGLLGGLIGALVLLKTPNPTFLRLIPYLLGSATLLFVFSPQITAWVRSRNTHMAHRTHIGLATAALIQLFIAIYIGFFGAGAGIMMLAMFAIMDVGTIHTMNAYKTVMASVCNGIAIVTFILARAIVWPYAILMLVGAAAGGYAGAHYAQKMNPQHVRLIVIFCGAAMSLYFFLK
jgi:hypothetical protein